MNSIPLIHLLPGETGVIEKIAGNHHQIRQKLLEMGLTSGTTVKLIRFAPLGDPIEISVRGYNLSLRKLEAESVIIKKAV
jgi:ferrous iron transport protein A